VDFTTAGTEAEGSCESMLVQLETTTDIVIAAAISGANLRVETMDLFTFAWTTGKHWGRL
jgi:hypothetical protein